MIKIVVADDEAPIRDWLSFLLEKHPAKYQLAGAASDGREAYQLIVQHRPDVVITDIKMPGMDGLELVRRASEIQPQLYFVILTNYADFSYAREAVACGAFQYLLKAELEQEDIYAVLDRLEVLHSEDNSHRRGTAYGRSFPELRALALQAGDKDALRRYWEEWGMDTRRPFGVLGIPRDVENAPRLLVEVLEEQPPAWYTLLLGTENVFIAFQDGDAKTYAVELTMRIYHTCGCSIGVGRMDCSFADGATPFQWVKVSLARAFLLGKSGAYAYERLVEQAGLPLEEAEETVRAFIRRVEDGQYQQAARECSAVFDAIKHLQLTDTVEGPRLCKMLFLSVQHCRFGVDLSQAPSEPPHNLPEYCARCQLWLEELATNALSSHSEAIRTAIAYIREHYRENLPLPEVAAKVYLSTEYFCRLFKEETGENFSTHLILYRLHKAKELLRTTDLKVSQVAAEVGYTNHSYFSRIYKRYMGKSPEQEHGGDRKEQFREQHL